ncbi:MAG: deoxyhypusine synthase family protein, partial [Candidatus Aenigmatarchaeota archaeon]
MVTEEQLKKARDLNYLKSEYPKDFIPVKGHDFSQALDFKELLSSYKTTGFQATHLGIAIDLIKKMREENVTILLSYTSNIVTSGLRDVIAYLVKKKLVHVLCTSAGGIEEDIMKCFKPFILGDFHADTKELYTRGMNRTGNIYTPDEHYVEFEKFLLPILEKFYQRQKDEGKIVSTPEMINEFGSQI